MATFELLPAAGRCLVKISLQVVVKYENNQKSIAAGICFIMCLFSEHHVRYVVKINVIT